ncbi:RNA-directed DNA polymerase from mobile element jockey [Plakobranchus ocellatus]|uniref:RNA-directed DNA polymerase from mobile element jockey n=1 Tax=Plakobranchus ocellatus TaxID=259542 RepID=A0AAV3YC70_9GAST|nr:RNA-directed DNA polymerase from mobile element jockey [Plakobranchus ocellatus]
MVDILSAEKKFELDLSSDREPTYLHSRGGLFRPDIALISTDLEESTTREVLDDVGSDHLPSLITINCCASAQGRDNKPKWNYRKANWSVYRDTLDSALSNVLPDKLTISALNEAFTRAVIHAARRGIPRGVIRKYSPIWSTEFAQAVAKRKQARREYIKSKTITNRKRYNALCRRVKKIGQVARTKEWRRACENLNPSSDPKMAWQIIRRVNGRGNTARVEPLIVKGIETNSDRREADAFNKHFSKVNTVPRDPIADPRMHRLKKALERRPTASKRTFETEFTVSELDIALRKGRLGKAPGLDGVTQEMISQLSPKAKNVLLNLYNRTWKSGELPRAWRTAVLVPILKKGKCPTAAGTYRPISLTSVISKTMERMTTVQWIPSHIGIFGNEIADELANDGRGMPQPRKPLTLADARSILRHGTAKLWNAAQVTNDERIPRSQEARKARDLLKNLPRSDAVQIFRARAKHTLLLADRARHGWSATTACRLCGEQEESIAHVLTECRELADVRPGGWPTVPLNEILWCGNRVAMTTAATIMRKFLRRAMR